MKNNSINVLIELSQINKIFANKEEKLEYLELFYNEKMIKKALPNTTNDINNEIINTWEFSTSNKIIREMFTHTEKYKVGKFSSDSIKEMMKEWEKLNLGEFNWPFHPMAFDQYIQNINTNTYLNEIQKDEKVKFDIVKFRRIKKINTARNDFIEYLIVDNNENVTPTLKHNRGIDFYINGYPFDQKVSRSVTTNFMNDFGPNWKEKAKESPELVAEYLYKYQDEARFGAEPRLLIVYLDEDISDEEIYKCVIDTNLKEPKFISFEYNHSNNTTVTYNVECYIILLHK